MIGTSPADPGTLSVTFTLRYGAGSHDISLVGDFNGWSRTANPMASNGYGMYSAELVVSTGRVYRFRYLIDGVHWQIDWGAKRHAPNEIGGHDSILDLTKREGRMPPKPRWVSASRSTSTETFLT